jgi:signal transduction histidine kinase/ActR/RegA family two-component response regulator
LSVSSKLTDFLTGNGKKYLVRRAKALKFDGPRSRQDNNMMAWEDFGQIFTLVSHGFSAIVANFGVLSILAWSVSFIDKAVLDLDKLNNRSQPLLAGLIFGIAAMIAMRIPLEVEPGIIADMRGVPLFFSGYLAGPIAAFICFVLAVATRLSIGGAGLIPGLGLIVIMAATGLVAAVLRERLRSGQKLSIALPVLLILVASTLAAPLIILLPQDIQFVAFWTMQPNMTLANVVGAFMLLKLFSSERSIEILKNREQKTKKILDARIRRMIQNSPGMVYQYLLKTSGEGLFTFMSEQGFRIYEISREEFAKDSALPVRLVHADDQSQLTEKILRSAQTLDWFEWDGRIVTPKGTTKWVKARSVPEKLSNGDVVWDGLLIDITNEVNLQHDLDQQRKLSAHKDKLASIGELAAGVGHEINNPLAVVLGNLRMVLKSSQQFSAADLQRLQTAEHAANRISDIVTGLRSFSRTDDKDNIFDAHRILQDLKLLFSEIYRHQGVELVFRSDIPEKTYIAGSVGQLQQSIVNLLANARDATEGQAERAIKIKGSKGKGFVQFQVADNGSGIPTDTQCKIFDTFFTTKGHDKGTGLGLSLSQKFIHNLGGTIELTETSKAGSVFTIRVPEANKTVHQNSHGITAAPPNPRRPLNVLVAEDSEDMRSLLQDLLEEAGCQSVSVTNGRQAAAELGQRPQHYDLLISDINMPELSGVELTKLLRSNESFSQPKILLITGGSSVENQLFDSLDSNTRLFFKPFGIQELNEALNWAVDSHTDVAKGWATTGHSDPPSSSLH